MPSSKEFWNSFLWPYQMLNCYDVQQLGENPNTKKYNTALYRSIFRTSTFSLDKQKGNIFNFLSKHLQIHNLSY
jgi:hypothetical protein